MLIFYFIKNKIKQNHHYSAQRNTTPQYIFDRSGKIPTFPKNISTGAKNRRLNTKSNAAEKAVVCRVFFEIRLSPVIKKLLPNNIIDLNYTPNGRKKQVPALFIRY